MWTQFLTRPRIIERLYDKTPSLAGFRLTEITFDRTDGGCMLRGAMARFPDFPPSHWEDDANRAGIRLWLDDLVDFELDGWTAENPVDITIERIDRRNRFRLVADGEDLRFEATCRGLEITDIFAYHAVEPDERN